MDVVQVEKAKPSPGRPSDRRTGAGRVQPEVFRSQISEPCPRLVPCQCLLSLPVSPACWSRVPPVQVTKRLATPETMRRYRLVCMSTA